MSNKIAMYLTSAIIVILAVLVGMSDSVKESEWVGEMSFLLGVVSGVVATFTAYSITEEL